MPTTIAPPPLPVPLPPHPSVLSFAGSDAMAIRHRNLKAEGNIRTVGACISVIGAIGVTFFGVSVLGQLLVGLKGGEETMIDAFSGASVTLFFALIPALFLSVGNKLGTLKPNSRSSGQLVCALTCLAFLPFGLALGIAGLVSLGGSKSKEILSHDYAKILEATPQIQSRRSWIIAGVFGLIILFYSLATVMMMFSGAAKIAHQAEKSTHSATQPSFPAQDSRIDFR